jgi:hypothetical protein
VSGLLPQLCAGRKLAAGGGVAVDDLIPSDVKQYVEKAVRQNKRAALGGGVGAAVGAMIGGPLGAALLGGVGGLIGSLLDKRSAEPK